MEIGKSDHLCYAPADCGLGVVKALNFVGFGRYDLNETQPADRPRRFS